MVEKIEKIKINRKYFLLVVIIVLLLFSLVISYNENMISNITEKINVIEEAFSFNVYALKTDQSSTSTKKNTDQSSTYKSSDMVDLLARLINGEARGEPYLRSSSSWSCRYE